MGDVIKVLARLYDIKYIEEDIMIVISGGVIVRDNKVLMVKEAQKKCYGQWNFPAGHVDELEKITDAAIREIFEETGCKVKLTGVLPIYPIEIFSDTKYVI